ELLADTERNKGTRGLGRPHLGGRDERPPKDPTPTLADLGINKSQSSQWQKLAGVSDADFEELIARAKQKATAAVDRAQQPNPKPKPKLRRPKKDPADVTATCVSEVEAIVRAAISKMDSEGRAGLQAQLQEAIRAIMAEAAEWDADEDIDEPPATNSGHRRGD